MFYYYVDAHHLGHSLFSPAIRIDCDMASSRIQFCLNFVLLLFLLTKLTNVIGAQWEMANQSQYSDEFVAWPVEHRNRNLGAAHDELKIFSTDEAINMTQNSEIDLASRKGSRKKLHSLGLPLAQLFTFTVVTNTTSSLNISRPVQLDKPQFPVAPSVGAMAAAGAAAARVAHNAGSKKRKGVVAGTSKELSTRNGNNLRGVPSSSLRPPVLN